MIVSVLKILGYILLGIILVVTSVGIVVLTGMLVSF